MKDIAKKLPIEVVVAPPDAHNYIKSSWVSSNRKSRWYEGVESAVYFQKHGEIIEYLMASEIVLVARWKEHPEQIYGWICFRNPLENNGKVVVHYCYVGAKFRDIGIARHLLNSIPGYKRGDEIVATHYSQLVSPHIEHKYNIKNNPYFFREEL